MAWYDTCAEACSLVEPFAAPKTEPSIATEWRIRSVLKATVLGRHRLNRNVRPMKTIVLSIVFASVAGVARSSEPTFTPAQIDAYIQAGSAKSHGAAFANQGVGCRTYLWKESADHHVFFFRRDGVTYGEFRDEVLADGRFLSIFERYLVVDARKPEILPKAQELRFVCKETILVRKNNVWVESKVRWSLLTTNQSGTTLKRGETVEKRMIRGVVSVVVPDELTPTGETFFVDLKRNNLTPHEKAFGNVRPVFEHFGLSNRRCSLWAKWPEDDPQMSVILRKKLPNPLHDAAPFLVRTEEVASMTINLNPPRNVPFVFVPDKP